MKKYILTSLCIALFIPSLLKAQTADYDVQQIPVPIASAASAELMFNEVTLKKRIIDARLQVKLDWGNEYTLGNDADNPFQVDLSFSIRTFKGAAEVTVFPDTLYTVQLSNAKPEVIWSLDLRTFTETVDGSQAFTFDKVVVTVRKIPQNVNPVIAPKLRLNLLKEIRYGLDVREWQPIPAGNLQAAVQDGKKITLTWFDTYPLKTYHLQLLRLFNVNENTAVNDQHITARADWRNAFELEVTAADAANGAKTASVTIAEGTGYYAFRIRPYSQYVESAVADHRNWGPWSDHLPETVLSLPDEALAKLYFFYTDPDDARNWIYNRIFAEGNRMKEVTTYANGLQHIRQAHTYLPSQDVTLVTQTVLDHSGRPALVSLPVPLEGRQPDYIENFMRAAGSELYQAKHFDDPTTSGNPAPVDQSAPGFSYFNGSDSTLSDAEGYPFSRTLYYSDGVGRAKEKSGTGKRQMIGNQTDGKGRTTRYFYATPSESELVALFGDEAPTSESVVKTISIDPNNTASVVYTSKDGKLIASSLSFSEVEDSGLLPLDGETSQTTEVYDTISNNSKTPNGFISTKRITLLQPTDFHVGYSVRCEQLESLCFTSTLECDYQLIITLHKLDDYGSIESSTVLINTNLSSVNCSAVAGTPGDDLYKVVPPVISAVLPGTYLVEKKLIPGDASVKVQDNAAEIAAQITPITNQITGWLETIEDESQLNRFFLSLQNLADAIYLKNLDSFTNSEFPDFPITIAQSFFTNVYNREVEGVALKELYQLVIDNPARPTQLTLTSPCCTIDVPVVWIPPFDCTVSDKNGNGQIDVSEVPDFEEHAFGILSTCYGEGTGFPTRADLENVIYTKYMKGWERKGVFNLMVYHMLTDQYNAENTVTGTPQQKVQYKCEDLLACWEAQVTRIQDELCTGADFNAGTPPYRVSKGYEDEQNSDPDEEKYEKSHDQHFDDSFKGGFFLTRWIAKRKISKRMRNLQVNENNEGEIKPDPGDFHMVKEFLQCSGQKFAYIITPFDASPFSADVASGFSYRTDVRNTAEAATYAPVPFKINRTTTSAYFAAASAFHKGADDYYYAPLSDWNPKASGKPDAASLFPNIKNPIYAFKYFEYNSDTRYQPLELEVCYSDPNDCYVTETVGGQAFFQIDGNGKPVRTTCCATTPAGNPACYADNTYPHLDAMQVGVDPGVAMVNGQKVKYVVSSFCGKGRVRCSYTHDVWSAGQRLTFYQMLRDYVFPDGDEEWTQSAPLIRDCNSLQTPYHWYTRKAGLSDENPAPELVNENELSNYSAGDFNPLTLTVGDSVKQVFSFVQMEMVEQVKGCASGCEGKRGAIRTKLMAMLEKRCYVVGGCRTDDPSTFNVIPEEDIDAMVESIVAVCMSQCKLTSFSCGDVPCREIRTSYTSIGPTQNETTVVYGVGGMWNNPEFCNTPAAANYDDLSACTTVFTRDIDGDGQPETVRRCATENAGIQYTLSYYEQTLLTQATQWEFDVELPPMCRDAQGNIIPVASIACCTDAPVNGFKGSTFLDKSSYQVNPNEPPDASKTTLGAPVYAPAVGINVSIQPNN